MRKEMRDRLLARLEEATLPFRLAQKTARLEEGWLRGVRLAVGMPVEELARRQGIGGREISRLELMERKSRITLWALRRAAEAMDCELNYCLTPKRGTLSEMAAVRSAAQDKVFAKKRVKADDRRSEEGKPRRRRDAQLEAIKALVMLADLGSEEMGE
jgi:transcriptional regulator with XRE-family HTH domain